MSTVNDIVENKTTKAITVANILCETSFILRTKVCKKKHTVHFLIKHEIRATSALLNILLKL